MGLKENTFLEPALAVLGDVGNSGRSGNSAGGGAALIPGTTHMPRM